jgi:hypothetical protein
MFFGFERKNNNWVSAGRPSDLRLSVTKDATTSKSYKLYFGIFFQSSPRFFWANRTGFSEHTSLLLFPPSRGPVTRVHVSIYSWCFKQKIDPEKLERWRYSVLIRPHFCLSPLCPSVVNFIVFIEIWLGISLLAINIIGRKVDVVALLIPNSVSVAL